MLNQRNIIYEGEVHPGGLSNTLQFQDLLSKAQHAICRIIFGNGYGTGFFCKIKDPKDEDRILKVLFTCNHILNKEQLISQKQILLEINHEKIILNCRNRRIWTNDDKTLDYTCIEILKEDGIQYFLNIDENIIEYNYSVEKYKNAGIYIFGIMKDLQLGFDLGYIKEVENSRMAYNCNSQSGCSGGAIINKINNSVIGIHQAREENDKFNLGIYIKSIINDIKNDNFFEITDNIHKYGVQNFNFNNSILLRENQIQQLNENLKFSKVNSLYPIVNPQNQSILYPSIYYQQYPQIQSQNQSTQNLNESLMSDKNICNQLDRYLNNETEKTKKEETKKPGNGFRYYGQLTKAGKNLNGETIIDQDTPLVHLNVGGIPGFNLFGVLDGHGSHGHFVSQYCRDYFIRVMDKYAEICKQNKLTTPEAIYNELKRTNFAYIIDAFHKADYHMKLENKFDYNFSGTTCNIVFQFYKYLVCASVGNSRGILVYDEGDKKNNGIYELSIDHKPNLPGEYERIISHGGLVEQMTDNEGNKVGPLRVWKRGFNSGLSISRALGDFTAKEAGVISTPQITEYTISLQSKYMIICSDGVWEFINNEKVRDMGNAFLMKNDVGGFCIDLVKLAMHSWEQFDEIRDNITVVCVFF